MIQNFPITASCITYSHKMFGTNFSGNRDKTMQKNPDRVVMDYVSVPKDFIKSNKFVTLLEDVMFVNDKPL